MGCCKHLGELAIVLLIYPKKTIIIIIVVVVVVGGGVEVEVEVEVKVVVVVAIVIGVGVVVGGGVVVLLQHSSLHNQLKELKSCPQRRASFFFIGFINIFESWALMLLLPQMAAKQIALSTTDLKKICNILLQTVKDLSFLKKYSLLFYFLLTASVLHFQFRLLSRLTLGYLLSCTNLEWK